MFLLVVVAWAAVCVAAVCIKSAIGAASARRRDDRAARSAGARAAAALRRREAGRAELAGAIGEALGKPKAAPCGSCNALNPATARFCRRCGGALG